MNWLCGACTQPFLNGVCQSCAPAEIDTAVVGVAHDTPANAAQIMLVLRAAGFFPATPQGTLDYGYGPLPTTGIDALILDVAYSSPPAFLLIETIRASERADLPVILISSVYSKTAYKRRPTSLYGADDYVEQHHIPDMLPEKLSRLLRLDGASREKPRSAFDDAQLLRIEQAADRTDLSLAQRIDALAKAIVADIALYHQTDVEKAVRQGDLGPLRSTLREGRRVFERLMGAANIAHIAGDPVGDALADLLSDMRDPKIAEVS